MSKKWLVPGVIGAIVLVVLLSVVGSYNSLVTQRENVERNLANVQTQYQRRSDLVPNLVSTVKGAANFEQETLNQVVEARAKATSVQLDASKATPQQLAAYQNSQGELSQALGKLLAVTESYPQLQATQSFRDLQVQLEGTENRITVARKDFNDSAAAYNAKVKRFPANITAGVFGFDTFSYFQATQAAQTAPTVDFE